MEEGVNRNASQINNPWIKWLNFATGNIMFVNINTRKQYPSISDTLSENTVYKSFIIYCKFNSSTTLTGELLDICIDNKSSFEEDHTIDEKIKIMNLSFARDI